jgi:GT2 family glycosyltransferase
MTGRPRPLVTALVLSHRSRQATLRAVASLEEAHRDGVLRCVVVDNDSRDGTVEAVRARMPWATVVRSERNLGFARGCNLGLARVDTRYVLLLNPDAELPLADLRVLLAFLEHTPLAGMVGPAIHTGGTRLQHAGGAPTPWQVLVQACRPSWLPRDRRPIRPGGEPFRTDWLCGAVLLLRMSMLRDVGSFDPRFFLYFEETDLCRRATARGWQLWTVGRAVAKHVGGVSARATGRELVHGCIAEHYFRSRFRYFRKHYGLCVAGATELLELLLMGAVAGARRLLGRDVEGFLVRLRSPILGRSLRAAAAGRTR